MRYAIIPAAGLATRFLPASKCVPKELFPILDKPAAQYIVEEAVSAGINSVIFITGMGKESVLDHFDIINPKFPVAKLNTEIKSKIDDLDTLVDVISVRQKKPLGLGHAVMKGAELVDHKPFSVLLPDMLVVPTGQTNAMLEMVKLHEHTGKSVIALMRVPDNMRNKYGMVEGTVIEKNIIQITKMLEKPTISETSSNLAVVGRYILTPAIIEILENQEVKKGNEIQLTDAIVKLLDSEGVLGMIIDDDHLIFDTGSIEGFVLANSYLALKRFPDFRKSLSDLLEKHS